jgi:MGT family glycosyltransferase
LTRVLFAPVDEQVAMLSTLVADWHPDLIAVDPMIYGGVIVAERSGVPWASIPTALNPLTPPDWRSTWVTLFEQLDDARRKLAEKYGVELRFRTSDAISPWVNTVFAVEELVPRAVAHNEFSFYVGPSKPIGMRGDERDFDWSWLEPDRPLVYISFGSMLSPEPDTLRTLATMFEPEEAQVVLVAKDVRPLLGPLPSNVLAVEYAPQIALLEKASVMISHGGCNGVLEGLSSSTPLLVVPLAYDQPMNGELVRRAGAGLVLPPVEVTRARVRELVVPMLRDNAPERAAATLIGAACRRQDGAQRAAELLVQVTDSRSPILPS